MPKDSESINDLLSFVLFRILNSSSQNPLNGINYKFAGTGVTINIPYHEYKSHKHRVMDDTVIQNALL